MEFGKVSEEQILTIDFTLPPDGAQTASVLTGKPAGVDPKYFIGCAKWGRKEWVNLIYPPKTKEANFLDEYVKHFNCIELNAAFYSMPKVEQVRKWKTKAEDNASDGFLFCPKFPQIISHMKKLRNATAETDAYLSAVSEFSPFLGPSFLQLSDSFGPSNFEVLESYLKSLPVDFNVFVELRHVEWYSNLDHRNRVFEMLKTLKKGAIITDASGRRDILHMELTIPQAFIRFVGNGQRYAESDFKRIDDWVVRLKTWLDKGLEQVYFFLHQHDERDTPVLANYTISEFNKHLGSQLPEIKFITKEGELF